MKEILEASICQLRKGLKNKDWSAAEIVSSYLGQIEKHNGEVNAIVTQNTDAMALANEVDKKISQGGELRPLEAIPVGIKDMLCTKGMRTTAGSKILSNYVPPYSATVVERLQGDGAIVLGKCNQDEFAMGSSNELSEWGVCRNPWNKEYVPGGSSGGSAATVAARMALASIGTDTGGSIRQPASFCGVVGIKPTYGRVSRYGIIAFASSLDQAGPIAQTVEDAALIMESICGYDPSDSTSSQEVVPQWGESLSGDLKGLRVGLPQEFFTEGIHSEVKKAVEKSVEDVRAAGAEIVEVSLPHVKYSVPIYYLIATSEASSNLARYDGVRFGQRSDFEKEPAQDLEDFYSRNRGEGFGSEVKRRIMLGTFALSSGYYEAYYHRACQIRRLLRNDFVTAFEQCDVMLSAVATSPAFKIGERVDDPVAMYNNDIFTTSTNLAGLPGMSVPVGLSSEKLPIGVQLTANHFREQDMLNVGYALENVADFKRQVQNVVW